jgi:hypothetical protein
VRDSRTGQAGAGLGDAAHARSLNERFVNGQGPGRDAQLRALSGCDRSPGIAPPHPQPQCQVVGQPNEADHPEGDDGQERKISNFYTRLASLRLGAIIAITTPRAAAHHHAFRRRAAAAPNRSGNAVAAIRKNTSAKFTCRRYFGSRNGREPAAKKRQAWRSVEVHGRLQGQNQPR